MPTARELLEQADALMRRNRMGTGGDLARRPASPGSNPPSVSPASGLPASPRTIQREPIAPSVARPSLPVGRTESPAFVARAPADEPSSPFAPSDEPSSPLAPADEPSSPFAPAAPVTEPQSEVEADADFPLLTDAVDETEAAAGASLDDLADDVPVLTDAVEEIDVGIVDEAARGEPSYWELTARGETSVLGPAPDSIAVVPLPEEVPSAVPQLPPEGRDPLGLDQPPLGYQPADTTGDATLEPADRAGAIPLSDEAEHTGAESGDLAQPRAPESEPMEAHARASTVDARIDASQPVESHEAQPVFPLSVADVALQDAEGESVAAGEPMAETLAELSAPEPLDQPLAAASESEQQRIREIAEEIGMQVLQRIDIFTDTALRAQLGERLRPVVDRAAADLVAAINDHVGELLRAYISEAIEREIESWRSGGR